MPSPVGQGSVASRGASLCVGALPSFLVRRITRLLTTRLLQFLDVFAVSSRMTPRRLHIERLALSILDGKGIEAIWQLHLDAAHAYHTGYPVAAEAILELAEAAERELMRRPTSSVRMADWKH